MRLRWLGGGSGGGEASNSNSFLDFCRTRDLEFVQDPGVGDLPVTDIVVTFVGAPEQGEREVLDNSSVTGRESTLLEFSQTVSADKVGAPIFDIIPLSKACDEGFQKRQSEVEKFQPRRRSSDNSRPL